MPDKPVKFLLVDDLEPNLMAFEAVLRRKGLELLRARSGHEALEVLLAEDISLLIVDIQMPGMDGFELAELVRGTERTRDIPIIFVTAGLREDQHGFRGYELGAVDFLFKPIAPRILKSKADVFFRLACQREQLKAAAEENEKLLKERTEAERRARESEAQTRRVLDNLFAFVWLLRPDGRLVKVNRAPLKAAGISLREVEGKKLWDCPWWNYSPEAQAKVQNAVSRANEGEVVRCDLEILLAQESVGWLDFQVAPLRDSQGDILFLIASAIDITERKQADQQLRESEARLRIAKTAAKLGIYDYNLISGDMRWDKRMRELWGIDFDAPIRNETFLAGVHVDDRASMQEALQQALNPLGSGMFTAEYRVINAKDKSTIWIAATGQTTFSERGAVRVVGTVQDITERKRFEEALESLVAERTAKLQEMLGDMEHFSYSITHDMKAPLRAIRGFAELIGEVCPDCKFPQVGEYLDRIKVAAHRMDGLITGALNYSRAVREQLPLTPIDLQALLRGMIDSYPEIQGSKADISLDQAIPPILGNEAALTQCFSNLLGNAVKFVPEGNKAKIRVWAEQRDGWLRVWVEDNGIGIPEGMMPRIFDLFSRGQTTYEGTGIGLALVRKVVERMGGRVGAESQLGEGSRFWVELRRCKEEELQHSKLD